MSSYETQEKQSSIEVSRNAKGDYAFKIKTYYDEEHTCWEQVTEEIQDIMNDLQKKFK